MRKQEDSLLKWVLPKNWAGYTFPDFMEDFEPSIKNKYFRLRISVVTCHFVLFQNSIISVLFFKITL